MSSPRGRKDGEPAGTEGHGPRAGPPPTAASQFLSSLKSDRAPRAWATGFPPAASCSRGSSGGSTHGSLVPFTVARPSAPRSARRWPMDAPAVPAPTCEPSCHSLRRRPGLARVGLGPVVRLRVPVTGLGNRQILPEQESHFTGPPAAPGAPHSELVTGHFPPPFFWSF